MATPGMQWAQLWGNLLGQGNNQVLEKQQGDRQQQQIDIQKQQEQRAQHEADLDFHQRMREMGAKPVVNGMVEDQQDVPGYGTASTVRKVNPDSQVKWKDSTGDDVAYELPSMSDQLLHQFNAQNQPAMVQARANAARATAQAEAEGTAAGQTQGRVSDLQTRGQPLPDYLSDFYHYPRGRKVLPEQAVTLSERATPAQIRSDASTANTDTRVQGQQTVEQMREAAKNALQQQQQQFSDDQNQRKLQYQDQWSKARNAITAGTQNALNSRMGLRTFDAAQQQHGKLQDQMYKESQKQLQAQALLDKNMTPDNSDFTDPWSGKKMTMNYAQRLRLTNALGMSQQQVVDWKGRAAGIENRYLSGQQAPGGGGQTGGGGNGGSDMVHVKTKTGTGWIPRANLERAKGL